MRGFKRDSKHKRKNKKPEMVDDSTLSSGSTHGVEREASLGDGRLSLGLGSSTPMLLDFESGHSPT